MGTPRFTPEFKEEAVRQITERGYSVAEVSDRLGVSAHSLYKWLRAIKPDNSEQHARDLLEAKSEILKLRAQLKRTEEERDILKKGRAVLCKGARLKYRFINEHRAVWGVMTMCRVLCMEQLMTQLRTRLSRLMGMRRESNERMADFVVADVSLFWLLNVLNSAEPVLGQFQRHPQSPPERLYPESEIQAQGDEMTLDALKDIRISSSEGKLVISAKQEIILTSGGGYIRIADGALECAAPDKIIQRAAVWQKFGGQSMSQAARSWESADFAVTPEVLRLSDNSPVAGLKLGLTGGDGSQQKLATSVSGATTAQNNIHTDTLNASLLDKT